MRIVSLVPQATEIVFALGAGDRLVGVSHECDYPAAARALPQLTRSALAAGLSPAEVDSAVSAQVGSGNSLYELDEDAIEALDPDLILTQELCPVCAVSTEQVETAVTPLPRCPELLSLDPRTLEDVFRDIRAVGAKLALAARAEELVSSLRQRLATIAAKVVDRPRPRVAALEWLDPPFAGGHWVPEMIRGAGGEDTLAAPGDSSRRLDWAELAAIDPDWIVAMPCGFDAEGAQAQIDLIAARSEWRALRAVQRGSVRAVDANGLFSRPGPRLVDGVERLAEIFHGVAARAAG